MKKVIITIVLILILSIVLILDFLTIDGREALHRNWGIDIPGNETALMIYEDFFQDGDGISIYKYRNKEKIEEIKEVNHFNKIDPENRKDIEDNLQDFYNGLGTNIKDINGKEVYDKNINVEQLLSTSNYYLIKRKGNSYIILILDIESKSLYTFVTIRH